MKGEERSTFEGQFDYKIAARAPHDSTPAIRVEYGRNAAPVGFTLTFAAGIEKPEREVCKADAAGEFHAGLVRKAERLFVRAAIPVGHEIIMHVRWEPAR